MSTRAVYTFIDNNERLHVYKHQDGYPRGAAQFIEKAKNFALELPIFEADDFAHAFIAANKLRGVYISVTTHFDHHSDLSYRYEVTCKLALLHVKAYQYDNNGNSSEIFFGTLEDFIQWAA